MDLLRETKKICQENNIVPQRSKGQNFLVVEDIYDDIIAAANLGKDDIVLEVGPGLGFLTERLAQVVKKVIAVELDDKLAGLLRIKLKERGIMNVRVLNMNVLDLDARSRESVIGNREYKVVANLPYNITSVFLRKFLGGKEKRETELSSGYPELSSVRPSLMVLMLQKEVGERICASPPKMSLLAISVQYYANAEIVRYVDRNNFWPSPAVDSCVLRLDTKTRKTQKHENTKTQKHKNHEKSLPASQPAWRDNRTSTEIQKISRYTKDSMGEQKHGINEKDFFRLVKVGFSARRKMLKNNLAGGYQIKQEDAAVLIKKAGFSEKVRAQELSVDDWVKLFGFFRCFML